MIKFIHKGDFKKTEKFLNGAQKVNILSILNRYGKIGISALSSATPIDTGLTASSWDYIVESTGVGYSISWINSNVNNGVNIAIILQYGHGTGSGYFVEGRDYINPAIIPIFDKIVEELWKEVITL